MSQLDVNTIAVRTGIESDGNHGAVVPPIYLSTNYVFQGYGEPGEYDYSRCNNPTRNLLSEALAKLEHGDAGIITNTGMSAINVVLQLLSPGQTLVVPHDCYGGSYRLFTHLANKGHFKLHIVDQSDEVAVDKAFADGVDMLWIETPSNPLLRTVDIYALCEKAKSLNANVVVDNTFLSPVLQQPLTLGADIVIHSTTKYINGHSDVVGGAIVAKTPELSEQLAWWANCIGATGSAFDSYLTLRGIRTLSARMKQHEANAMAIAQILANHPVVSKVHYPGLEQHPDHQLASKQQRGFGGMVSFELAGGEQAVKDFMPRLELFSLAESLGGVESLVCHPGSMTHAAMDDEAQKVAGIEKGLIRLSVGIEATEDLVNDLKNALDSLI